MKTLFELKGGYGGRIIIYPKNEFNPQPFIKVRMLNNETNLCGTKELRAFANNILKALKPKKKL